MYNTNIDRFLQEDGEFQHIFKNGIFIGVSPMDAYLRHLKGEDIYAYICPWVSQLSDARFKWLQALNFLPFRVRPNIEKTNHIPQTLSAGRWDSVDYPSRKFDSHFDPQIPNSISFLMRRKDTPVDLESVESSIVEQNPLQLNLL